jgi:NADPH-dependent 2,4-dienoyl-CoA reductase/sulfur reductase-like enzyme
VTFIHGRKRVEAVTVAQVDADRKPIRESERLVPCDSLVLSVGLIPENELSLQAGVELDPVTAGPVVDESMHTSVDGIFACGNVVGVFDLVDWVTRTAEAAGRGAAEYVLGKKKIRTPIRVSSGRNVKFVIPQLVRNLGRGVDFYFRVERPERAVRAMVFAGGEQVYSRKARMVRPPEMIHAQIGAVGAAGKAKDLVLEVVAHEE